MVLVMLNGERAVVFTLAGGASGTNGAFADAVGTNAGFNNPFGVAVDASGNVFVGDFSNQCIRKVTAGGGTRIGPVSLRACFADISRGRTDVNQWDSHAWMLTLFFFVLRQCVWLLILSFFFCLDAHLCEMLECVSDSDCDS